MSFQELNRADLWFTVDGDFLIDGAGDLKDTNDSGDYKESAKQAILHRIIGERNAFRMHPNLSAGLEKFIGKTINKNLLEGIEYSIHKALTSDRIIGREDYSIRVIELTPGDLAILIYANLPEQSHPLITMAWNIKNGEITRML